MWDGTGSTSTITNNIDLSGEGGLVWIKKRSGSANHTLQDTVRGATKHIRSSGDSSESTEAQTITAFNSNGFSLGTDDLVNASSSDYVGWTFRKAPKFFDVGTISFNSSGVGSYSHNLGVTPAMVIFKLTNTTGDWFVWHKDLTSQNYAMFLNSTVASSNQGGWATYTDTTVSFNSGIFANDTAVVYLFAHNNNDGEFGPDADQDVIKCGSYTGNGSATGPEINLGFEPQWLIVKAASTTGSWRIIDNMRGWGQITRDGLFANSSGAEDTTSPLIIESTATGFRPRDTNAQFNGSGQTYIYMAIRRGPLAAPESATDVFAPVRPSSSGTFTSTSGFVTDFSINKGTGSGDATYAGTRLTGPKSLTPHSTAAEFSVGFSFDFMDKVTIAGSGDYSSWISWNWKRAPSYFDVVAFTKTTSGAQNISHNLGAVPEMMWIKVRNDTDNWTVYHKDLGNDKRLLLNGTDAATSSNNIFFNSTTPTASQFTIGSIAANSYNFIAYLFATVAGVSKVGSYTGNGSSSGPTVDCGFSGSPRFVLIKKATGGTGSWYVFDSVRGIVAGAESQLYLNNNAAEQTATDQIDPTSSGFQIVINSGGLNTNGETYIFYAIA